MSEEKKSMVTPTGRIVFLKNLFVPDTKGKYSASLIFDDRSELEKLKNLLLVAAKSKFDEATIKSKKFKWGLKTPDEEAIEKYDFFNEESMILNASTKFEVDVLSNKRGADGKFLPLIDGDLKAGDYCRFLVSPYAWENKVDGITTRGVNLNLLGVQFMKSGEALYSRKSASSAFDEVEFDVETSSPSSSTSYDDVEW